MKVAYLLEKISRERSLHNFKLKNGYITGFEEISFMLNRSRDKNFIQRLYARHISTKTINKKRRSHYDYRSYEISSFY